MRDRVRYAEHCEQHLDVLRLLALERREDAAVALTEHLNSTLKNLTRISSILSS